jgi:hypothetical protein
MRGFALFNVIIPATYRALYSFLSYFQRAPSHFVMVEILEDAFAG